MHLEKTVSKTVLAEFKRLGFFTQKLETSCPGFPDSLVSRGDKVYLIEFKYIEYSRDVKLSSLFQVTQPPFYARWFDEGGAYALYTVIYAKRKGVTRYYLNKLTYQLAVKLPDMMLSEYLSLGKEFKTAHEIAGALA